MRPALALYAYHEATLSHLEMLLLAVRANDPRNEIELRVRDLIVCVKEALEPQSKDGSQ